jgi:uncharacterized protein (DUF1778 family)
MGSRQARAERLEARVTSEEKGLLKEAANAKGVTLTDFVVSSVHEAAVRTLQERNIIELGRRDQQIFVEALLNPEAPNKRLHAAAKRHGSSDRVSRSHKR